MINRVPRTLLILVGLAVVGLLFYRQAAFSNLIFARGDTLLYFYPYWDYRAQTLLAGHLPLWNPYLFMGVPFLANSQAGVFYPFNWPLIIFSAPVAVKISIVAHVILATTGTYALARQAFGLETFPAALAALVLGSIGCAAAGLGDAAAFFPGWLAAAVFWLGLPLAALTLVLVHDLTGGRWMETARPALDAIAAKLYEPGDAPGMRARSQTGSCSPLSPPTATSGSRVERRT